MPTANENLLDALVRHQIYLLRFSGSTRNKIIELLNATEADMEARILRAGANFADGATSSNIRRSKLLIEALKKIRLGAWSKITETWVRELVELAKLEPQFVSGLYKTVSPVQLDMVLPATSTLRALVLNHPLEGRVLRDWAASLAKADVDRISNQIRIGMVQGEGPAQLARRVVGSASLRGSDGVTQITRRNAEAITRTAVNSISNAAKRELFKENRQYFDVEVYVATLDERTTTQCASLDGKQYPVGKGPIPPLHFNCRSLRVALLSPTLIGSRPMKTSTQRGLVREYQRANDLKVTGRRGDLPRGTKGPFDEYARRRVRELTGPAPATLNYQEFLTRQSREFQEDVLGKTRARLFRTGRLPLTKFVNRQGDDLNLSELARRHGDVFRSAGLDPETFLG